MTENQSVIISKSFPVAIVLKQPVYTKLFSYFIDKQDYPSLKAMLERVPDFATDANSVLEKVYPLLQTGAKKVD